VSQIVQIHAVATKLWP